MTGSGGAAMATDRADRRIRVGLLLPQHGGDVGRALEVARSAEDLGYDGVFAFDHLFPHGAPDRPVLDPFVALAVAAAATRRISVGTLVARAVLRSPGLTAKMASTLGLVAPGRVILGVGSGDPVNRPEHEAFGFPDLDEGARREHLAEWLEATRALFAGGRFPGGRHVAPVEGPLLPLGAPPALWVGGLSEAIVRLAARLADGWNGWGLGLRGFRARAALLAGEAERAGRPGAARPTWGGIAVVGETEAEAASILEGRRAKGLEEPRFAGDAAGFTGFLLDLADAGATWAVVVLGGPAGRRELVAERTLPALG